MDWRIQSLGSLESKSIHHAIYWSSFWLADMLWNQTNVLCVKHFYSKQPKLYSLCPSLAVSDMTEHDVWISTVLAKTKQLIYSIKEKTKNWRQRCRKLAAANTQKSWSEMEVVHTWAENIFKKGFSHTVTLPITGFWQPLQGRAQGGVP